MTCCCLEGARDESKNCPDRGADAMSSVTRLYGAVEAGGTKFICAIGDQDGQILDETRIETRDPTTTLTDVCRYFAAAGHKYGVLTALGVGAFGPLDLKPTSPTFGFITSTPKPGWKNTDLAGALRHGVDRRRKRREPQRHGAPGAP